ncbi:hypothetical protein QW060_26670 [Myroides ceti]|uniref:Uncharacterized protein n=1 Tax=Paenimyroides ceti TaxID=395087 RepID=A0ABT8D3A4_9FLAO|nr:hypothetical protein [Paenimyroides ceti]MDN3710406.1 hypothetical protein [Paenimyroides ceti]
MKNNYINIQGIYKELHPEFSGYISVYLKLPYRYTRQKIYSALIYLPQRLC